MNPDASLSFAVRGTHAHVQHVCGDLDDLIGSVGPRRAAHCVETSERILARSRCCHGRSRGRSAPGRGSGRTEKIAQLHQPVGPRHTDVDETRNGWDTAPAYVLGTMWGVAPIGTCQGWDRCRACPQRGQRFSAPSPAPDAATSTDARRSADRVGTRLTEQKTDPQAKKEKLAASSRCRQKLFLTKPQRQKNTDPRSHLHGANVLYGRSCTSSIGQRCPRSAAAQPGPGALSGTDPFPSRSTT